MSWTDKIFNGWSLVKQSLAVILADKEILLFPVLSIIISIGLTCILLLPILTMTGLFSSQETMTSMLLISFLIFFAMIFIVSTFFKAAIISSATIRFSGKNPTLIDGLRQPTKRIFKIIIWAIILTAINMIIATIRGNREKQGGIENMGRGVAAKAAETTWNLLTYFTIPIILFENLSIWESTKKSTELFKKTWGENITAQISSNIIFNIIGLPFMLIVIGLIYFGINTGNNFLILIGVIITIVCVVILATLQTTVNGVLVAALYRYAQTGKPPLEFQDSLITEMFI